MDDLATAFAIRCDEACLTRSQGRAAAEALAEEILDIANERPLPADMEDDDGAA